MNITGNLLILNTDGLMPAVPFEEPINAGAFSMLEHGYGAAVKKIARSENTGSRGGLAFNASKSWTG